MHGRQCRAVQVWHGVSWNKTKTQNCREWRLYKDFNCHFTFHLFVFLFDLQSSGKALMFLDDKNYLFFAILKNVSLTSHSIRTIGRLYPKRLSGFRFFCFNLPKITEPFNNLCLFLLIEFYIRKILFNNLAVGVSHPQKH